MMNNLDKNEELLLSDIEKILNDKKETIFCFFKEESEKSYSICEDLRAIENKGMVKVNWLDDIPINVELTELGKSYFKNKEKDIINNKKNEQYLKRKSMCLCFISFILGVILGLCIYHFLIK